MPVDEHRDQEVSDFGIPAKKILVVDDVGFTRLVLRRLHEPEG